jgi:NADPH:quinone reductase-like Zn-dependent oxidoreductase
MEEPGAPAAGEIRVRLHASSLNYHDYGVASSGLPQTVGRIPLSDGAGVVEAAGPGVSDLEVGDSVVSVFFPFSSGIGRFRRGAGRRGRRLCERDHRAAGSCGKERSR